jgi:hypothetical protein
MEIWHEVSGKKIRDIDCTPTGKNYDDVCQYAWNFAIWDKANQVCVCDEG